MPLPLQPPDECAHCGAAIPAHAKACPECGADERTGWREADPYDGIDLPGEAFAEDPSNEAGKPATPAARVNGVPWYWWTVGVVLLILLAGSLLGLG